MNAEAPRRFGWLWLSLRILLNLVICSGIIAGAVAGIVWINQTEPVAEKVNSTRKSAALVETVRVSRGDYAPRLIVLGTVRAARQISLRPRVNGQVVELSDEFSPGGMVQQGDLLMRIDPADFENTLSIRNSELDQANASMKIETARQELAKKELELLEDSIDETNRELVLRKPQLDSIKAEVSAAAAAVARAKLDLKRTEIYAPFDAQVLSRAINLGSQVGPGDELGQMVGVDEYWVMAAVPIRSLRWVSFPASDRAGKPRLSQPEVPDSSAIDSPSAGDIAGPAMQLESSAASDTQGSRVLLRNPDAWGPGVTREARVSRLMGTLDQQTRLARVLITVKDPLGLHSEAPPLILESLLETEIEGRPIENVVRLDRAFIRNQDTVWVMQDEQLEIREIDVEFVDDRYAYIGRGLEDGDEVVTSTLATVAPGIGLRKIDTDEDEDSSSRDAASDPREDGAE